MLRPAPFCGADRQVCHAGSLADRSGAPNSVSAIGRTWLAIIGNYQQKGASVVVTEALRPYLDTEVLKKRE